MTHFEYARQVAKPVLPCSGHYLTFGGLCLNCGYDPKKHGTLPCPTKTGEKATGSDILLGGIGVSLVILSLGICARWRS